MQSAENAGAILYGSHPTFGDTRRAVRFSPSQDAALGRVELALERRMANDPSVVVSLYDNTPRLGGSVLEVLQIVSDTPPDGSPNDVLATAHSLTHTQLDASETYWIVVEPANPQVEVLWRQKNTPGMGGYDRYFQGSWRQGLNFAPALRVLADESFEAFCNASDNALASCPCANPGDDNAGCDLPQGTGGVTLEVALRESQPEHRALLVGSGFPADQRPTSIVIRAADKEADPVVFGDGIRCVGTPVVRFAAAFAKNGSVRHVVGHNPEIRPGDFHYQLWFRSEGDFWSSGAFNLSSGVTVPW